MGIPLLGQETTVAIAAYALATKGFSAPIDLVFPVVYVALGVAFARGRLGA